MSLSDLRMTSAQLGDRTCILSLAGELDLYNAGALRAELEGILAEDYLRVVVDLLAVTFIDSTGLGILVSAAKRLRAQKGELVLVSDDPNIVRVFQITGLDRIFAVKRSLSEAIDELVGRIARV